MATDHPVRPLRRDAVRNRARILEAAAELFAEQGLGATLNEVARHAGVGVGTVYRHFPDREDLMQTLLEDRVDRLIAIGEAGLTDPDPWRGLTTAMERGLELQAGDRSLRELVHASPQGLAGIGRARERLFPIIEAQVRRAQAAGAVRPDVDPSDVPVLQMMVVGVIEATRGVDPDLWRRYLALVLRAIAAAPESLPALPPSAMTLEQLDQVMTALPR